MLPSVRMYAHYPLYESTSVHTLWYGHVVLHWVKDRAQIILIVYVHSHHR